MAKVVYVREKLLVSLLDETVSTTLSRVEFIDRLNDFIDQNLIGGFK